MPRFSARTMAVIRRSGGEMLTDTCSLFVESGATGALGEPLHDLELVASGVACRVIRARTPSGGTQMVVGSQESMVETYRLECAYDQALAVDMVAVLDSSAESYRITSIEDKLTDSVFAGAVITRVRS